MTPAQKVALRASEIRRRLAELGGLDELNDEQRSEIAALRTEYQDVESRAAALIVAEDDPVNAPTETETREGQELADLIAGASIGDIFAATLEQRSTDGRTRELQTELGLSPNVVPLALLREPRLETRAVTPAPADVGQQQAEIIPGVFPQSCAAFLGVDMPTVGVGEAVYPVLTQNATVHKPAEGAAAAETTGSFSADVLSPRRLQASFFYSREDRARFRGMDAALRQNLSDALSDSLDAQILAATRKGCCMAASWRTTTSRRQPPMPAMSPISPIRGWMAAGRRRSASSDSSWARGPTPMRRACTAATTPTSTRSRA